MKNNKEMEVEFMTLLERDREKKEGGIAIGRAEGRIEGEAEAILELLSEYGGIYFNYQVEQTFKRQCS